MYNHYHEFCVLQLLIITSERDKLNQDISKLQIDLDIEKAKVKKLSKQLDSTIISNKALTQKVIIFTTMLLCTYVRMYIHYLIFSPYLCNSIS